MTAHFTLDFDDLLAFQKDVIQNAHTHEIKRKYFKWITSILILFIALLLVQITLQAFITILGITIIYFFIFSFLYNYLAFMKLKGQMQKSDYSHVLGNCKVTISDEGIERNINGSVSQFDWAGFEKADADDQHYFLYVSDLQGLIIAKTPDNMTAEKMHAYNQLITNYIREYISKDASE